MKYLTRTISLFFSSALIAINAFSQPIPENQYFDSDGVRIRFIELGSGEPIIAIHGFTRSSDTWLEYVSALAESHRLILFDQRGHGLSDKPHAAEAYGRELGQDVIRLMDHLDIPKAHILGYSLGVPPIGMVITEYESRFISAIVGGAAPRWNWGNSGDNLNQQLYERVVNSNRQPRLQSSAEGQDQLALAYLRLAERDLVVSKERLANLNIPVLAIVGSEDPALEAVENFEDILPSIELVIIDGENHLTVPGHREFMESIKEFLGSKGSE